MLSNIGEKNATKTMVSKLLAGLAGSFESHGLHGLYGFYQWFSGVFDSMLAKTWERNQCVLQGHTQFSNHAFNNFFGKAALRKHDFLQCCLKVCLKKHESQVLNPKPVGACGGGGGVPYRHM